MTFAVAASLSTELDLHRAWRRVWRDTKTDFLVTPIVYEVLHSQPDQVVQALREELSTGSYHPEFVRVIEVPKADQTTRPAGVLSPRDRIIYQALVDRIAEDIEPNMKTHPDVFGFRLDPDATSDDFLVHGGYTDFRERVEHDFGEGFDYLLKTDIAAYFECIESRYLQQTLQGLGARGDLVDAVTRLINHWNRNQRVGIPQGVWPSDYLGARAYLDRADKAMELAGHRFFRYSDDLRVGGRSILDLRRALRDLVVTLRNLGLHLQSGKTELLRPEALQRQLRYIHEKLKPRTDLAEILQIDPASYETPEATLERLSEDQILESERVLNVLSREAALHGPVDIELCRLCIQGYYRIKSERGLPLALHLLVRAPSLTREVVRYVISVVSDRSAHDVKVGTLRALHSQETIHGWQRHWLLYLLCQDEVRGLLTTTETAAVYRYGIDRNNDWPSRAMAVRLMGRLGDQPRVRSFVDQYDGESDPDLKHAIMAAALCLGRPERNTFYQSHKGSDQLTDLLIGYLSGLN